ncbi:TetR/AcrR family transcriptional regulator [Actinoplanes sp. GCM10030250]|uniref:TetR/AcrR family transcriptional regulator n=1 Tax=Actinoplanes sp. GCM10030250 TaxID=3273376 RepID=UPI0036145796
MGRPPTDPSPPAPGTVPGSDSLLGRAILEAIEGAGPDAGLTDDNDEVTTRLLDAAHAQFCRMGIRRSTMEDVARRAGVSRITAYRRFATKDALVKHVIRREFRRYFDQFPVDIQTAGTAADRVVLGFVSSLQALRHNQLIGGLMTAEPDVVIPSLVGDGGLMLATVQRFVAGQLRKEQHAGHISGRVDVELVAELMTRLSCSFLVTPSFVVDLDDTEQLSTVARRFLAPMLQHDPRTG